MTLVKEVATALKIVTETVESIQTLTEAISKGKDYLKTKHPHVQEDLAKMCEEMRKSSRGVAEASAIITNFSFVIGDRLEDEASRFNDLLVQQKALADNVETLLYEMRGHCSVIADHAEKIKNEASPSGLTSISAVLGLHSEQKERELAKALQDIYDEEMQVHKGVYVMANAIKSALKAVRDKLGPPGRIDPARVPEAAEVLGEQAIAFLELESKCKKNALELQDTIFYLRKK